MVRPDLYYQFNYQTNYNLFVFKWAYFPIHECELYKYGVNKVLDYFIVVWWIEPPISNFSKVEFKIKISKQVILAFTKLLDHVGIDKHIVERLQMYFLNCM